MNKILQHQTERRQWRALTMLWVFLAYLVYLPIHAVSVEHCLPGVAHEVVNDESASAGEPHSSERAGHSHHQHPDGSSHHTHHTAADHEVESTGKTGSLKWVAQVSSTVRYEIHRPVESRVVLLPLVEDVHVSFAPGKQLISRGPPVA